MKVLLPENNIVQNLNQFFHTNVCQKERIGNGASKTLGPLFAIKWTTFVVKRPLLPSNGPLFAVKRPLLPSNDHFLPSKSAPGQNGPLSVPGQNGPLSVPRQNGPLLPSKSIQPPKIVSTIIS